jgi:ABC-type antimicrobial peptide transport system permease subunit
MHQFYEAAGIALQAIWANKLRSLLTVIGNVVAVTSIIAVVSLIQGLNAAVQDAILSQAGAEKASESSVESCAEPPAVSASLSVLFSARSIHPFSSVTISQLSGYSRLKVPRDTTIPTMFRAPFCSIQAGDPL